MLRSSEGTVNDLLGSLNKIREFFGPDIIQRAGQGNVQRLLLEQLENLRSGKNKLSSEQVQSVKKLLEAIKPLNNILEEKRSEISTLMQKANEEDSDKPIVIIREKIQDPIDITLDDASATLEPTDQGVMITVSDEGAITTQTLPAEEE
jgi:hypothetical protein